MQRAAVPTLSPAAPPRAAQKRGKKALVLDPALSGPLTLLDAQLSALLTEHGVAKCGPRPKPGRAIGGGRCISTGRRPTSFYRGR
jgi:hypothetical protein